MCGIVGMVSKNKWGFNMGLVNIFNQMLVCDSVRGPDSTGVFGIRGTGNVDYLKQSGDPFRMINTPEYKEWSENMFKDFRMVVGHNRKATVGSIKDETAHPFQEDHIILVHNGTLYNHKDLTEAEGVEVDSHAITHSIAERGYEETIKELDGAFTLVWYDINDKCLRVCRNDKRPLFIGSSTDAFIFASEAPMIEWLCGRDSKKVDIFTTEAGHVYTFDVEKPGEYTKEKVELRKPDVVITQFPVLHQAAANSSNLTVVKGGTSHPKNFQWNISDFSLGARLTFKIEDIKEFTQGVKENGPVGFLDCTWIVDSKVRGCIYLTRNEMDDILELDETHVTAEIDRIAGQNGKVTRFYCKNFKVYVPEYDATGDEVFQDEYDLVKDKSCRKCGGIVNWRFINLSRFKYKANQRSRLICHECVARETSRKVANAK